MRLNRNFWTLALIPAFALTMVACSDDKAAEDDMALAINEVPAIPACGAKCDSPTSSVRLVKALTMSNYEFNEADSTESFRLIGEVADEFYYDVFNGDELTVTVSAFGEDVSETSIDATLTYEEEGVDAYITEAITSADLMPREVLNVRVKGQFLNKEVDQIFAFEAGSELGVEPELVVSTDPWADAKNVTLPMIVIDPAMETPDYDRPVAEGFSLGGTEFWQKWEDGLNPTYSYSAGTVAGRKCMYASARRFEAVMATQPEALIKLREDSNWSGSFFNWNDDFSPENANGSARGAVLWAWRTSLVKWISQTGTDGRCYLPTLEMVESAADNCLTKGQSNDGEIQGCQSN